MKNLFFMFFCFIACMKNIQPAQPARSRSTSLQVSRQPSTLPSAWYAGSNAVTPGLQHRSSGTSTPATVVAEPARPVNPQDRFEYLSLDCIRWPLQVTYGQQPSDNFTPLGVRSALLGRMKLVSFNPSIQERTIEVTTREHVHAGTNSVAQSVQYKIILDPTKHIGTNILSAVIMLRNIATNNQTFQNTPLKHLIELGQYYARNPALTNVTVSSESPYYFEWTRNDQARNVFFFTFKVIVPTD